MRVNVLPLVFQVITKTSRVMFARHRDGFIFPIMLNVNSYDGAFVAIIQRLNCRDDFVWFYSKTYAIVGASHGSLSMMGVSSFASKVVVVVGGCRSS